MTTLITSLFYITVLFNGQEHNLVSCKDGRHYREQITVTRVMKTKFLAKDKTTGEHLICNYTK